MTDSWRLPTSTTPASAKSPRGRVIEKKISYRGTRLARSEWAAEWPKPGKPSSVARHWFSTKKEAQRALAGPLALGGRDTDQTIITSI